MTDQRDIWFTDSAVLAPGVVVLLTACYDLLSGLCAHKSTARVLNALSAPFGDFLTLEDLKDPVDDPVPINVWKTRILAVLTATQSTGWLAYLMYSLVVESQVGSVQAVAGIVTWGYATARIIWQSPRTPPYMLILLGVTHVLISIRGFVDCFGAHLSISAQIISIVQIMLPIAFIWLAGTLPLRSVRPCRYVAGSKDVPSHALSMPEDGTDLWGWCTFSFVQPILELAAKKTLDESDVWRLSPYSQHRNLFEKYLRYHEKHPSHSLLRFLVVSNSLDLVLDISLELWNAVIGFVPSYALQCILSLLASSSPSARNRAYIWALATFLANLSFAQKALLQSWHTRRCYERTRGQLLCILHWKALKRLDVSGKVTQDASGEGNEGPADLGKIVNLMQGDAYAVAQRFWEFSGIFASPIRLVIALIFLYNVLGWSALSAVTVVLVADILNYPLAKYKIRITRNMWKAKDKRMNIVNELFQNIRFLKFYGWENFWDAKALDARENELRWRVRENIVETVIVFIWTWMPSATAAITFVFYTLVAKEHLTVSKAFTAIALFSQLQAPMTALPGQVFALLRAYVSMQRIQAYLNEEEIPDWASSLTSDAGGSTTNENSQTGFENASFIFHGSSQGSWNAAQFKLGPLDVVFPTGKLSLVTGATGSGKTALLTALLGEMHCVSGAVNIDKRNHHVAYCAQNPWLEHATIRDNIIFGSSEGYNHARYCAVLDACALERDLAMFEAGDLTEIGEKGITLSGGQRARVALARAIYSSASCILLDDPLAAVDMHTAQHIVSRCLSGDLAEGRTIILVTHHVSLCLPVAKFLMELSYGRIVRQVFVSECEDFGQLQTIGDAEDSEDSVSSHSLVEQCEVNEAGSAETLVKPEDSVSSHSVSSHSLVEQSEVNGAGSAETLVKPEDDDERTRRGKLVEVEKRAEGRVSFRTYWTYIRAAGVSSTVLTLLIMILLRVINVTNQFYLARWGEAYNRKELWSSLNIFTTYGILESMPPPDVNVMPWLMIYLAISMASALSVLSYIAIGYYASLRASRSLFKLLLVRLTHAPSRFFDITPIGRILNRFTSDVNILDGTIQSSIRYSLVGILNFIMSGLVILTVVPGFAPFAAFVAWLYIRLAPWYIRASRDLRRLESISLSPAFAGFDELLRGLAHVRAFAMESRYQESFYRKVDIFQSYDHAYWLVNMWLVWRYDCLGSIVVFCATIAALFRGVTDGSAAIVIVQAGIFADASRQLVKAAAHVELDFNSIERIVEYLDVSQEAPSIVEDKRPPAYWPSSGGQLVVEDLSVRYASDQPLILKNLSLSVRPSEKIGIVGRTGSGKSTLALSLLRMVEPVGGQILIDGIDISTIGLEDLRTRMTIVSQDVAIFSGTLRSNLDPFEEHTDQQCWDVLERCHLKTLLSRNADQAISLDMQISQSGSLSAGERQLVALARAVLRRTNIVIMDEATSQIDSQLDDKIQKTIREELSYAMVITIAHRLRTIIDYDRVLVLDAGEVVEFDTPQALFKKPGGAFRDMCRKSADWPSLSSLAGMEHSIVKPSQEP